MIKVLNLLSSEKDDFNILYNRVVDVIESYPYDQYKLYPAKSRSGWEALFLHRLRISFSNEQHFIFYDDSLLKPVFIIYHINNWDETHFGIKMAKTVITFSFGDCNELSISKFVQECEDVLRKYGVKFVSSRINGDNLLLVNGHLGQGYSFYETIIWPVAKIDNSISIDMPCKLATNEDSLVRIKAIANNHQYQRGHFHCDTNIDNEIVNLMYSKWVETSYYSDDFICVIEDNNEIAGYFVCGIDDLLKEFLGYEYGRLKSLALDSSFRGKGLGINLFKGTLQFLKTKECEYIDSGYATKNHTSAFLHSSNSFYSVYEEVTLHKWI